VANGDGVGEEIMSATLAILRAAGAPIKPEFITVGEEVCFLFFPSLFLFP
jgi:isocitrate dehydrogenase